MLKFFVKSLLVIAVLTGIGYAAYFPISKAIAERNKPRWRTVKVDEGTITRVVNATGTVRPVKKVQVGSFVSGPIMDLFVEFNQEVKQNEILATIDPRLFAANVARDKATLAIEQVATGRRAQRIHQSRFPGARGADQCDVFSTLDGQRGATQRMDFDSTQIVGFANVVKFD